MILFIFINRWLFENDILVCFTEFDYFQAFFEHEVNGLTLGTTSIWLTQARFIVARYRHAIVTEFELTTEQ